MSAPAVKPRLMPLLALAILLPGLTLLPQPAPAREPPRVPFEGRVVRVADGDSITVLVAAPSVPRPVPVRLAEIDAPERGQPWSRQSRQALSQLVAGLQVEVRPQGQDRWGRVIGQVRVVGRDPGGTTVNREMVRRGAAWVYRPGLRDLTKLALEREARAARRGLWALPESQIEAPWLWRARQRAAANPVRPSPEPPSAGKSGEPVQR